MHDDSGAPSDRGHAAYFAAGMIALFVVYFGVFGVIILDEGVFRTMWLSSTMNKYSPELNQTISAALRFVYAPLIKLAQLSGLIP